MSIVHLSTDSFFFSLFKRIWQAIRSAELSEHQADYFLECLDLALALPSKPARNQALQGILQDLDRIKAAHNLANRLRSPIPLLPPPHMSGLLPATCPETVENPTSAASCTSNTLFTDTALGAVSPVSRPTMLLKSLVSGFTASPFSSQLEVVRRELRLRSIDDHNSELMANHGDALACLAVLAGG